MTLVQFPLHLRSVDVRRCALALRDLNGEEANRYWRDEMRKFAAALRRVGLPEQDISEQALLFLESVQGELRSFYVSESAG
ncbi:DUF6074 family protein [Rhizobium halophilum]|uniref:DUF6074 family protein n=1 Tax=Rhizobium halophilum TaxID=2846852 RepID=UPI001EFC62CB|nr:DUF6074 family protein [Rhizobium halophilum]MCF6370229.1 DUF6074 family protein [Rhizobium halophilum]